MNELKRRLEAKQRKIMNALIGRLTKERLRELVEIINPNPDIPGRPEHYLNMVFRAYADLGRNKARWKDDQKTALEQVEASSKRLQAAIGKLDNQYKSLKMLEIYNDLDTVRKDVRAKIERGSILNTTPPSDSQALAFIHFYIEWSLDEAPAGPVGNCYKFLLECMTTMTGEYPQEDGRGGLRGAYKRMLPRAKYIEDHKFDFLGG